MENFAFTPESSDLEKDKNKQEVVENFSLVLEVLSKNNEEIHVVEEAIIAPVGKLSELYDKVEKKYKAMLAVLVFATSFQVGIANAQEEREVPLHEGSFEQTTEKREAIKKIVGFDVVKEAEKVGRHASVYLPKEPTKFTIIHLGQTHNTTQEANYMLRSRIAKSQSEIASFLTQTTTPDTHVFVEGDTGKYSNDIVCLQQIVSYFDKHTLKEIEAVYHSSFGALGSLDSVVVLNKIIVDKLTALGLKEVSPLIYSDGTNNFTLKPTPLFPPEKQNDVSAQDESNLAYSAKVLAVRGRIHIEPAETIEGNKGFQRLSAGLKEKGRALEKFIVSPNSMYLVKSNLSNLSEYSAQYINTVAQSESCKESIECQKITKEIVEADIPAIKRAVFEDREDIAVELIAKQAKTSYQNVFPLVYGKGHDFTRAVMEWNKAHPEEQFNLVTVK